MASASTVARTISLFADRTLSPEALSRHLAVAARQARDDAIATGDAPASYETIVDGRHGVREEAVRPDGVIVYRFNLIGLAAMRALEAARALSPRDSGDYARAWMIAVNGKPWPEDALLDIPAGAEVMLVNSLPYARKINVGAMPRMTVEPGILRRVRQRVRAAFQTIEAFETMVMLTNAFAFGTYQVPYVLRGRQRSFAVKHIAHIRANGGRSVATARKDLTRGQQMTYPALSIEVRR